MCWRASKLKIEGKADEGLVGMAENRLTKDASSVESYRG
jgi:hypothetical protein